jgi:cell division control protein 6
LTYQLRPLLKQKKINNLLIYGPPGTGKTLLSNYVLNELSEYSSKIKYLYINCIHDNTRFSILLKLMSLYQEIFPRRGLAIDEVWNRLTELFKKANFSPVIILDEIDKLSEENSSKILYDLSRFSYNSKYFSLILITNYKDFYLTIDQRTQSSLFLSEIEFSKYNSKDLKQILKERIEYGLIPGAISENLIGYISGYAAVRGGDARIAINLLYKAAKQAEKEGLLKITKEILLESSKLVDSIKLSEKIKSLSKEEYAFLVLLEDNITTSDIYKKSNVPQRTIRRYLDKFEKLEIIKLEKNDFGKGGVRKIILKFNKKILL